jgi:hypothetical protein
MKFSFGRLPWIEVKKLKRIFEIIKWYDCQFFLYTMLILPTKTEKLRKQYNAQLPGL